MGDEGAASKDGAYDVAAAIEAFVRDETAASLELPHSLSAEQRKQAKRVADQHKTLKCESFGFGAERRLCLFKQAGQLGTVNEESQAQQLMKEREPWSPVRVKNTFIDDFVDNKDTEEHLHFRSLPNRFGAQPMWTEEAQEALQASKVSGAPSEPPPRPPPPPAVSATVPGASDASSGSAEVRSEAGSAASVMRVQSELPELPEGFKFTVRDTFIHIEEAERVQERAIQSMPEDGMFQRHLQAERRAAAAAAARPAAPQTPPPPGPASPPPTTAPPSPPPAAAPSTVAPNFPPGTEVTIEGLSKLPAFNGRSGTVDSYDAAQGRYNVLLDSPATAGGSRWAKVKGENLRLRLPPPPHHSPVLTTKPPVLSEETFYYAPPSQSIPPTPQWEDSYRVNAGDNSPPLKLDALV